VSLPFKVALSFSFVHSIYFLLSLSAFPPFFLTSFLRCIQSISFFFNFPLFFAFFMGRDSSVGIATRYGVNGPDIESQWGQHFPHMSGLAQGHTQPTL
jgi:hypothetical protein